MAGTGQAPDRAQSVQLPAPGQPTPAISEHTGTHTMHTQPPTPSLNCLLIPVHPRYPPPGVGGGGADVSPGGVGARTTLRSARSEKEREAVDHNESARRRNKKKRLTHKETQRSYHNERQVRAGAVLRQPTRPHRPPPASAAGGSASGRLRGHCLSDLRTAIDDATNLIHTRVGVADA